MRTIGVWLTAVFTWACAGMACAGQTAPDLAGSWQGYIRGGTGSLRMEVAAAAAGGWRAVVWKETGLSAMESTAAAATQVSLEHSQVDFAVQRLRLTFHGELSENGERITGELTRAEDGWPVTLDLYRALPRRDVEAGRLGELIDAAREPVEGKKGGKGKADGALAKELSAWRLTERLSNPVVLEEEAKLPGAKSREALRALAVESAFADAPGGEMPAMPRPELAQQRAMVDRAVDYVVSAVHRMPNFIATRATTTYRRELWQRQAVEKVRRTEARVVFRDGKEEPESGEARGGGDLTTSGEFGPILGTLIVDAAKGHLVWRRWEGREKPLAIFGYRVGAEQSHYTVDGVATGYAGEFAIDPASGAIERLVFKADPPADDKLLVAEIAVEYGPVALGGREYVCPLRGYALSEGLRQTMLNEVVFTGYHVFHASMKVLPE